MFRPGTLLRSTCNTATASSSSATTATTKKTRPPPPSACSSSRALLAADGSRDSFLASSRRDDYCAVVARTESFSTAIDRLHRRGAAVAPAPPSRFSIDAPPQSPLIETEKKEKEKSPRERLVKTTMKLLSKDPYGFSSSDDDTQTDVGFSSDAGGEGAIKKLAGEAFFSSSTTRSFSSDSSEFYTTTFNNNKKKKTKSSKKPSSNKPPLPLPPPSSRTTKQKHHRRAASSCDTCGVRDGMVSAAEEQLRRGFAVVKRSRDPYADFRSSMVEMIVGRQLFAAPDLERLLRSYLSLNAPRHHPVILQAFSDIWVVLHHGG
ncbi:hypothetical protein PR202_gb27209 [Eleusine coracana subsp. coracana]|uniref:Transcription repressor n=1 Tax=Eleusine coracana subsp. coracana TaxID=191504 RepID=A0AAV5FR81_ELECO|nr:hypothetical protein PR202_gb27209 [Eleusine coracana subsp. coracana]